MKKLIFVLLFIVSLCLLALAGFSQSGVPIVVVPGSTPNNKMRVRGMLEANNGADTSKGYFFNGIDGDGVDGFSSLTGKGRGRWIYFTQRASGPDWWDHNIGIDTTLNNWQTYGINPGLGWNSETYVSSTLPRYVFNPQTHFSGLTTPPFDVIYAQGYNAYVVNNWPSTGWYFQGGIYRQATGGSYYSNFNPGPFIPTWGIDTTGRFIGKNIKLADLVNSDPLAFARFDASGIPHNIELSAAINAANGLQWDGSNLILGASETPNLYRSVEINVGNKVWYAINADSANGLQVGPYEIFGQQNQFSTGQYWEAGLNSVSGINVNWEIDSTGMYGTIQPPPAVDGFYYVAGIYSDASWFNQIHDNSYQLHISDLNGNAMDFSYQPALNNYNTTLQLGVTGSIFNSGNTGSNGGEVDWLADGTVQTKTHDGNGGIFQVAGTEPSVHMSRIVIDGDSTAPYHGAQVIVNAGSLGIHNEVVQGTQSNFTFTFTTSNPITPGAVSIDFGFQVAWPGPYNIFVSAGNAAAALALTTPHWLSSTGPHDGFLNFANATGFTTSTVYIFNVLVIGRTEGNSF